MKNKIQKPCLFRLLPTLAVVIAAVVGFALSGNSAKASGYSEAPPTGFDTGAEILITWNGSMFSISAPSGEGPFNGTDDTLFGVQNNSGAALASLTLSGSNIFAFDGNGINFFNGTGAAPGSPGPTGYEGWTSTTSTWGTGTQEPLSFAITDSNNGTVVFGASGIAAGGSAYFALEGRVDGNNLAVPEPATWAAGFLTAGALLCSIWRRRAGWLSRRTYAC
jgi:hypothetical protein